MKPARFEINPHVIKQLGSELVSDSVTAIMELIKNSYDADADYVKVTINTNDELLDPTLFYQGRKGYIVIEDNGCGMNEEIIRNSWLVISFSNKRPINGIKPKTKKLRTPLGDKGLGRLSTQRLASVCEIYSKTEDDDYIHAGFEWKSFDDVSKLSDVDVQLNGEKFSLSRGTRLVLTGLVDSGSWSGSNLERFKGQLSQLISPYDENKPFKVFLEVDGERIDVENDFRHLDNVCISNILFSYEGRKASLELSIKMQKLRGNALHADQYNRYILSDNGEGFTNFLLSKKKNSSFTKSNSCYFLQYTDEIDIDTQLLMPRSPFDAGMVDPGPFKGRIREFSFLADNSSWENLYTSFDDYKSFVQNQIGVKVYRNGFAIKPYGIDGQDWLELGKGQTSGSSFYGLRPRNVVGYVAIDEANNKDLKDKTDREGLIENDFYRSFLKINMEIIRRVNEALQIIRRSYNDYIKECRPEVGVKTFPQAVKRITETAQQGTDLVAEFKTVNEEIAEIRKEVENAGKDNQDLFGDQIKEKDEALKKASEFLSRYNSISQKALQVIESTPELRQAIEIITPMVENMKMQLGELASLASLGLVSEILSHDLGQIVTRLMRETMQISRKIDAGLVIEKDEIRHLLEYVKSTVSSIKNQLKHLDSSFKYKREERNAICISQLIGRDEKGFYADKLKEHNIDLEIDVKSDFTVMVNKGRMIQVFDNLINNSLYWLDRCKQMDNATELKMKATIKAPFVYFEDNGWGIERNVEDSIFEPFVTRKPLGEGRGLGLYIVKNLLNAENCDIALCDERNLSGRRYKFILDLNGIIHSHE